MIRLKNEVLSTTANMYISKEAVFQNFATNVAGSAIGLKNDDIDAFIESCVFINCTSTCSGSSNARAGGSSGGACFLSINAFIVRNNIFQECYGNGLGAALYASTLYSKNASLSCASDFKCGRDTSEMNSVYALERARSKVDNVNSTYSISREYHSTFHIGLYPITFSMKYMSIVFAPESTVSIPLGLSLSDNTCTTNVSHVYIKHGVSSSGIISLWRGEYFFDDIVFDQCSGNLYRIIESIVNVSFSNTMFGSKINTISAKADKCSTNECETKIIMHCKFKLSKERCTSIAIRRNYVKWFSMMIFLF